MPTHHSDLMVICVITELRVLPQILEKVTKNHISLPHWMINFLDGLYLLSEFKSQNPLAIFMDP